MTLPERRHRPIGTTTTHAAAPPLLLLLLLAPASCVEHSGTQGANRDTPAATTATTASASPDSSAAAPSWPSPGARTVGVVEPPPEGDRSAISVYLHGAVADVVVTDAQGRRLGVDPAAQRTYAEIPRGSVSIEYPESDEESEDDTGAAGAGRSASADSAAGPDAGEAPVREIMIIAPAPGAYTLTVVGSAVGAYDLDVGTVARDAMSAGDTHVVGARTAPRTVHRYRFTFDPASRQPKALALARLP